MKALILYRQNTEYTRIAEDYIHDFKGRTGKDLEPTNLDSQEGARMAELYGVITYPAILVLDESGVLQNLWQGLPLPLINEVSAALLS